jgi:Fe-Mn family superoxide dismutase
MTAQPKTAASGETFIHEALAYGYDALEPVIGRQTMELHHSKHYKAYIDKANELSKGTPIDGMNLEQAVIESFKQGTGPLFNNIGQAYNHAVFWKCMKPNGGGVPTGALADEINTTFGSFDKFKEQFVNTGLGQFGSGWVWLASNGGKLEISKSANGESPLVQGKCPLIGCDVWEHAYYLDYQNRRADYIKAFVDKLINWEYASQKWEESKTKGGACGTSCGCG